MSDPVPETRRIALITGASRGIGRAAALALAGAGAHVILSARTVGALEELDDEIRGLGGSASLLPLDLLQGDSIDALGPTLYQRWGRLDVLIANAGILGTLTPLAHVTTGDWQDVMRINVEANWRLIRTLDPLLRRSAAGRLVFVTSTVASSPRAYWGPYAVSKAALEALVKIYAAEMASTAVRANLLNPGPTRTLMRAKAYPGEDPATLRPPEALAPLFVTLAAPECQLNGEVVSAS